MCPRYATTSGSEKGFTLIEAMISMSLLIIVLVLSMTFLISMRTFSQRQEMVTAPRQTARRAMEYITYYVRGALDVNYRGGFPNILPMWYENAAGPVQISYNNLTGAEAGNSTVAWANTDLVPLPPGYPPNTTRFGDPGTDLINFAIPGSGYFSAFDTPSGSYSFSLGCGGVAGTNDTQNMNLFKQMTGCCDASGNSGLMNIVDGTGLWAYYKITSYTSSSGCPDGKITITGSQGDALGIKPPGGAAPVAPRIAVGTAYSAFRVKDQNLQQKNGIFIQADPEPADPLNGWNTILSNVEDLQVSYLLDNGTIQNVTGSTMGTTGNVPGQVPTGTASTAIPVTDITKVVALRVSVVTRSGRISITQMSNKKFNFRPAAEDNAKGPADRFFHYRVTNTVILRNRALGS